MTRRWRRLGAALAVAATLGAVVVVATRWHGRARGRRGAPGPVREPTLLAFPPEEAWLDDSGRRLIARVPCADDDGDDATAVFDPATAAPTLRCPRPGCQPGCAVAAAPVARTGAPPYSIAGLSWEVELAPAADDALAPAAVELGDAPAVTIRWAPARTLAPAWRAQARVAAINRVVFTYRAPGGATARFAVAPTITRGYRATLVTIVPLAGGALAWILSGNEREDDDRQATAWLPLPA